MLTLVDSTGSPVDRVSRRDWLRIGSLSAAGVSLTDLLRAQPASRLRFVLRGGTLVPVPLSPLAFAGTSLLSAGAKLRLLAEPFVRRNRGDEESVAEFIGRRLGGEVVSGMVGPFLTGVYAGDESQLGARAVFPRLVESEQRFGSLALGGLTALLSRGEKGLRGSWSAPAGFGPFARKLADHLSEPPALGSRVMSVSRDGGAMPSSTERCSSARISSRRRMPWAASCGRSVSACRRRSARVLR